MEFGLYKPRFSDVSVVQMWSTQITVFVMKLWQILGLIARYWLAVFVV